VCYFWFVRFIFSLIFSLEVIFVVLLVFVFSQIVVSDGLGLVVTRTMTPKKKKAVVKPADASKKSQDFAFKSFDT
jgi:hypothetical protein